MWFLSSSCFSRLRNSGTTSALFRFSGWRKRQFTKNSWQFTLQSGILSHGKWPWIKGYAQNCIHQTKVEFANPGHCPIVISRKMMWENTLKRENNYPPSTTSKVVLEDENESISPDFRITLSTVNLLHHINSEWIVCSLNHSTQKGKMTLTSPLAASQQLQSVLNGVHARNSCALIAPLLGFEISRRF